MIRNREPLTEKKIWSCLIHSGISAGIIVALTEVCWTYYLPLLFPGRTYVLPISISKFLVTAIVINVFIVLLFAFFLGVLILAARKLWQRAPSFVYWPELINVILISGSVLYLFVGLLSSYYVLLNTKSRLTTAVITTLPIVLISVVIVWFLKIAKLRLNRIVPAAFWILICAILLSITAMNYLRYRSKNVVDIDLPTINSEQRPNILLVTIDCLRADYIGCYGNKIIQTPVLDALAEDGCLFENAFSQASSTTPSHCSIMTSTYPTRHRAMNGSAMQAGFPTLAEILQANGYNTAAFVSCNMVRSSNSRLHLGFDYYEDSISPYTPLLKSDEVQLLLAAYLLTFIHENQIPGHIVSNRALAWLEKRMKEPFFCWLHYFDPHGPYDAPSPYKDMYDGKVDPDLPYVLYRSRYAGEVTYTDKLLGNIIESLKDKGLYDDMLIIVTADHGEAFGEKHDGIKEFAHGKYIYNTTQHVPLIIKLPGGKGAGRYVRNVVQLIDFAPTVLDLLSAQSSDSFQGKSLIDLLSGVQRGEQGTAYSVTNGLPNKLPGFGQTRKRKQLRAIQKNGYKYIRGVKKELYDVVNDYSETRNIYSAKRELADKLHKMLEENLGKSDEIKMNNFDPRVMEQLKSLGYIDGL